MGAMNECPDEVCAVRFADRFGDMSMTPIFMLLVACMSVIVGMGLYIYVTLGKSYRMATLVIFGFVAIPFHAVWYHKLVDALYVSIETRRRRTSASERRDRELKRARRKAKVKLDLAPDAIRKAWTELPQDRRVRRARGVPGLLIHAERRARADLGDGPRRAVACGVVLPEAGPGDPRVLKFNLSICLSKK